MATLDESSELGSPGRNESLGPFVDACTAYVERNVPTGADVQVELDTVLDELSSVRVAPDRDRRSGFDGARWLGNAGNGTAGRALG